jgi:hypothetical protein
MYNTHVRSLQLVVGGIELCGTALMAVSTPTPDASLACGGQLTFGFDVPADLAEFVIRAGQVQFERPGALRTIQLDRAMALDQHNPDGSWHVLGSGASVLDRHGDPRAGNFDPSYRQRVGSDNVLAARDDLDSATRP